MCVTTRKNIMMHQLSKNTLLILTLLTFFQSFTCQAMDLPEDEEPTAEQLEWIRGQKGDNLTFLELNSKINLTAKDLAQLSKDCPNIDLIMFHPQSIVSDRTLKSIVRFFPNLKELLLIECILTQDSLKIIEEGFPQLINLNLIQSNLTDKMIPSFIKKNKKLKNIDLGGTAISDTGLIRIAKNFKSLETINLNFTDISYSGLKNFLTLLPSMKKIWFSQKKTAKKIASSNFTHLSSLFPTCTIIQQPIRILVLD